MNSEIQKLLLKAKEVCPNAGNDVIKMAILNYLVKGIPKIGEKVINPHKTAAGLIHAAHDHVEQASNHISNNHYDKASSSLASAHNLKNRAMKVPGAVSNKGDHIDSNNHARYKGLKVKLHKVGTTYWDKIGG